MMGVEMMVNFQEQFGVLERSFNRLERGLNQIKKSTRLTNIFQVALAIGSRVNGKGSGFPFHTLLALKDARSPGNPRLTLLHYLVAVLKEKFPDALNLDQDLVDLEPELDSRKKSLSDGLDQLKKSFEELKNLVGTSDGSPFFKSLEQFLSLNEKKVSDLVDKVQQLSGVYDSTWRTLGMVSKEKGGKDPGSLLFLVAAELKQAQEDMKPGKNPGPIDLAKGTFGSSESGSSPRGSVRGSVREEPRGNSGGGFFGQGRRRKFKR